MEINLVNGDNYYIETKGVKEKMNTNWMAAESDNFKFGAYVVYRLVNGHREYVEAEFNYMSEAQEKADELNEASQ